MKGRALLALPPERVLRRIALAHLAAAHKASRRLTRRKDPRALHDLRVALRRLRSCLRAYAPYCEPVPEKLRKRLRRLARATNEARDTEVQIEWLRGQRRHVKKQARAGPDWLVARLEKRSQIASRKVRKEIRGRFGRLETHLRAALDENSDIGGEIENITFARATRERLLAYCDELADDLARIGAVTDRSEIHASRILAKRLRYLLEPLRGSVRGAAAWVNKLKTMQDRFGELNDRFVLMNEIAKALRVVGERNDDVRAGLLELADQVQLEIDRRYGRIRARYLGKQERAFIAPLRDLGRSLGAPKAPVDSVSRPLRLE